MICIFVLRVWSNIWIVHENREFHTSLQLKKSLNSFPQKCMFFTLFFILFPLFFSLALPINSKHLHMIYSREVLLYTFDVYFRSNRKVNIMNLRNTFWFLFCFFTFRTISKFYPSKLMQCMNHGYQIWFQWPKPIA